MPGLSLASSRSTNGSRGQTLFRNSALTGVLGAVPAYPNIIPASEVGIPFFPQVFVFDEDFQNPRTYQASVAYERQFAEDFTALVQYNYAAGRNITRFLNRNDALLGSPWSSGLAPAGINGIGELTTVTSTARSNYSGLTFALTKRWSKNYQFQFNYSLAWDKSDDDNERDPFSYAYAKITDLEAEYGYSDRDQRHRINGFLLWQAPGKVNVNFRYSYRSAQPLSYCAQGVASYCTTDTTISQAPFVAGPSDRVRPRRLGRAAQHRPKGQHLLGARPAHLPRVQALRAVRGRAHLRGLQPAQLHEPPRAPDHQPDLQLLRHHPRRPGRPPSGAARGAVYLVGHRPPSQSNARRPDLSNPIQPCWQQASRASSFFLSVCPHA